MRYACATGCPVPAYVSPSLCPTGSPVLTLRLARCPMPCPPLALGSTGRVSSALRSRPPTLLRHVPLSSYATSPSVLPLVSYATSPSRPARLVLKSSILRGHCPHADVGYAATNPRYLATHLLGHF
eukprot:1896239-Rhodomonas_salina.3